MVSDVVLCVYTRVVYARSVAVLFFCFEFFFYYYTFLTRPSTEGFISVRFGGGKRRPAEGKGGELAQRRYTTAAATHVVYVCVCVCVRVFYFSKHKEYYTLKF